MKKSCLKLNYFFIPLQLAHIQEQTVSISGATPAPETSSETTSTAESGSTSGQPTPSTVSEGSSDESLSAISLIQTTQISFYMELISLVNCSCDLEDEENDIINLTHN